MGIISSFQTARSLVDFQRSYWRVQLTTGRILSEHLPRFDIRVAGFRPFDWTMDLVDNSDHLKISVLEILCPGGQIGRLDIAEPGTAFQFKTRSMDALGAHTNMLECQVIGRVDNKEEGDCTCWIWDRLLGLIEYKSSVYKFGTWHERLAPIGSLSMEVMGLRL